LGSTLPSLISSSLNNGLINAVAYNVGFLTFAGISAIKLIPPTIYLSKEKLLIYFKNTSVLLGFRPQRSFVISTCEKL